MAIGHVLVIERPKCDFLTNDLVNILIRTEIFPESVMHLDNLLDRSLLQLMHWQKLFAAPKLKATHVGLQGMPTKSLISAAKVKQNQSCKKLNKFPDLKSSR